MFSSVLDYEHLIDKYNEFKHLHFVIYRKPGESRFEFWPPVLYIMNFVYADGNHITVTLPTVATTTASFLITNTSGVPEWRPAVTVIESTPLPIQQ